MDEPPPRLLQPGCTFRGDPVMSSDEAVLDARGLRCPEPVMLLHKAMAELPTGALLRVLATDPTTERDIPQFCRFLGHALVEQTLFEQGSHGAASDEYVYVLRKGN